MNKADITTKPLITSTEILAAVMYASPNDWGTSPEEVLLGHLFVMLCESGAEQMHLLAWPDGVRAMLPSEDAPGSPQMDQAVVDTYRAAVGGVIGSVVVGPAS